jgi:hypothetical protein
MATNGSASTMGVAMIPFDRTSSLSRNCTNAADHTPR